MPLNQRPTTVVTATMNSSEPTPSTNRPAIMSKTGRLGTTAGSTAMSSPPTAPIAPNSTAERRVPRRSMSTPPAIRVSSAATLYAVSRSPTCSSVKPSCPCSRGVTGESASKT